MLMLTIIALVAAAVATAAAFRARRRHRRLTERLHHAAASVSAAKGDLPIEALVSAVRKERKLRESIEDEASLLQRSLGLADFGLLVVDRDGDTLFVNPVAGQFIGARLGDAVAETRIRELLRSVMTTLKEESLELELFTPNRRYLGLRAAPLFRGDEPSGAVLTIDDLSQRYLVDDMRRDFVANASHELKTPLGALRVLAETLVDTDDDATRERLNSRLLDEATRMSRIVDDILGLAEIEGEAARLEPLRLDELLAEACGEVALLAKQHGIQIEIQPSFPEVVLGGDRTQLVSALSNLLENAIKYTVVDGDTRLEDVRVRTGVVDDTAVIEVSDGGIGIPEAHLDRIFERFYRVDRARSRQTGGTGLGLSIVRHVVVNHGGAVDVRSTPGKGSTFVVTLPIWQA